MNEGWFLPPKGVPMTQYLVIHYGDIRPQNEQELAQCVTKWTAWQREIGSALLQKGNPLVRAKMVGTDLKLGGSKHEESASGYSVIQAESFEEAAALFKNCPTMQDGGHVELNMAYPIF